MNILKTWVHWNFTMDFEAMLSISPAAGHSGQKRTTRRSSIKLSYIRRYSASLEFFVAFPLPDLWVRNMMIVLAALLADSRPEPYNLISWKSAKWFAKEEDHKFEIPLDRFHPRRVRVVLVDSLQSSPVCAMQICSGGFSGSSWLQCEHHEQRFERVAKATPKQFE